MDDEDDDREWAEYRNIHPSLAIVISAKLATLSELRTVYTLRDLYDLLEIAAVDRHNARLAARPRKED